MDVLVVRHGTALDKEEAASRFMPDDDRPLTKKGRSRTKRVAKVLAKRVPNVTGLLTSPLLRAAETAEIVGAAIGLEPERTNALLPGAAEDHLVRVLEKKSGAVAVVGHEPHLSRWIGWALTGESRSIVALAKSGVCLVHFADTPRAREGTIGWLLTPALVEELR